jgi:hypothetical protein
MSENRQSRKWGNWRLTQGQSDPAWKTCLGDDSWHWKQMRKKPECESSSLICQYTTFKTKQFCSYLCTEN